MQFVYEYQLEESCQQMITDIMVSHPEQNEPFKPSEVYNSLLDEKLVKPDLRMSEFRTFNDKNLFLIGDEILGEINSGITGKKFIIFENNITHIRYNPGGYFKSHEDYLSLHSNIVEEYTMIVCIKGGCLGGETILQFNNFFKYPSVQTKTTGGCLLFRKDIPHEGAVVTSGQKEIITYNVWAIQNETNGIVMVDFHNDTRKCILSQKTILSHPNNNIIKSFLCMCDKLDDVVSYTDPHTYEEFAVIEKIYNGVTLGYTECINNMNIIKYYLFETNQILAKSIELNFPAKKNEYYNNGNMIIFGDKNKYYEFFDTVKKNKLQCVPFKILFVEGGISHGGGMSDVPGNFIKMAPAWVSFSDNYNIVFFHNVLSFSYQRNNDLYQKPHHIDKISKTHTKNILFCGRNGDDESDSEDEISLMINVASNGSSGVPAYTNLLCYKKKISNTEIIKLVTDPDISGIKLAKNRDHKGIDCGAYTLTPENKIVLNQHHMQPIISKIEKIDLYKTIIKNLNYLDIVSAQDSVVTKEHSYCNEDIYGTFHMIMIYGGLFMD